MKKVLSLSLVSLLVSGCEPSENYQLCKTALAEFGLNTNISLQTSYHNPHIIPIKMGKARILSINEKEISGEVNSEISGSFLSFSGSTRGELRNDSIKLGVRITIDGESWLDDIQLINAEYSEISGKTEIDIGVMRQIHVDNIKRDWIMKVEPYLFYEGRLLRTARTVQNNDMVSWTPCVPRSITQKKPGE